MFVTPSASARVSLFCYQGSISLMCYLFLFLQTTEILQSSFSCYLLASSTGFFNHILYLISSSNKINILYLNYLHFVTKLTNKDKSFSKILFKVLELYFGLSVVSFLKNRGYRWHLSVKFFFTRFSRAFIILHLKFFIVNSY